MARIKFTTDSAADIPAPLREELDIQVLPFPIAMGDQEFSDGFDFTPEEFYDMLLAAPQIPTHAQLNPYLFTEVFEAAYAAGFTDLNYTMGYGWAVVQGARMAAGGAAPQEVAAFIQDWVDHVRVIFAPLDLRFAKKSGRVSAAAAFVGEALGLKPVMTFTDGESRILSKVRGEKAVLTRLVELCKSERRPGTPYLMIQGSNVEQSEKLLEACRRELGEEPALCYRIGGVIAINAGPNLVGVIYRT